MNFFGHYFEICDIFKYDKFKYICKIFLEIVKKVLLGKIFKMNIKYIRQGTKI